MGKGAVRTSRALVVLLFAGVLWVALEGGAFRYHLLASRQPASLQRGQVLEPDRLVEFEGAPDVKRSIRAGKGPFRFVLVPVKERQDLWLLFVGSLARGVSAERRVFRGRLVQLGRVPFVRRLIGQRRELSNRTLVVEVGHLPKRRLAWAFLVVFSLAFVGAQFVATFVARSLLR